jgi:hypothetical protein
MISVDVSESRRRYESVVPVTPLSARYSREQPQRESLVGDRNHGNVIDRAKPHRIASTCIRLCFGTRVKIGSYEQIILKPPSLYRIDTYIRERNGAARHRRYLLAVP